VSSPLVEHPVLILALAGIGFGVVTVVQGTKVNPPAQPVSAAAQSPYENPVADSGIIEANTVNIAIGTQLPGIVSKLYVQIGTEVKAGDPLFTIDDRAQRVLVALKAAAVQVADAQLTHAKYELDLGERLTDKRVLSLEDRETRPHNTQQSEAVLAQTKADLQAAQTDLERLTVRAPVAGQVMQLKVHLGEFAATGVLALEDAWTKNPEDAQKTFDLISSAEKELFWIENTAKHLLGSERFLERDRPILA
jgi:multidrug efflux pump subunit AcrA (membrane-fusion protein)